MDGYNYAPSNNTLASGSRNNTGYSPNVGYNTDLNGALSNDFHNEQFDYPQGPAQTQQLPHPCAYGDNFGYYTGSCIDTGYGTQVGHNTDLNRALSNDLQNEHSEDPQRPTQLQPLLSQRGHNDNSGYRPGSRNSTEYGINADCNAGLNRAL